MFYNDGGRLKLTEENNNLRNENITLSKDNIISQKKIDECTVELEGVKQYLRHEIVEFQKIPNEGTYQHPEDCYQIVKDFCDRYLDITISRYDISICHRQFNPAEKKKLGRRYIPAIYVKFVNRFLAHLVLKRKKRLNNYRNKFGQKFSVRENLTLKRRLLWESVNSKLVTYRFKWIRNGKIFVRKDDQSRAVMIGSDDDLEQLLSAQRELKPSTRTSNGGDAAGTQGAPQEKPLPLRARDPHTPLRNLKTPLRLRGPPSPLRYRLHDSDPWPKPGQSTENSGAESYPHNESHIHEAPSQPRTTLPQPSLRQTIPGRPSHNFRHGWQLKRNLLNRNTLLSPQSWLGYDSSSLPNIPPFSLLNNRPSYSGGYKVN